jgi:Uma2 family endonuclease
MEVIGGQSMSSVAAKKRKFEYLADLIHDLGVSPKRIRFHPAPGRATVDDLIRINERQDRIYELVDGTLVEKAMGATESMLAMLLGQKLLNFLEKNPLGWVLGPDGTLLLMPSLVRAPDICVIRKEQCPGGKFPRQPVPELVPALAVEVLSKSNRPGEMNRKLNEYFRCGVMIVWFIDSAKETVEVFTAPDKSVVLRKDQSLDGDDLLPGFKLPLAELFANLEAPESKKSNGKRKKRS